MRELEVHLQPKEHTFVFVEAKRRRHRQGRLSFVDGDAQNWPPASERKRNKPFEAFKTNLRPAAWDTLCLTTPSV